MTHCSLLVHKTFLNTINLTELKSLLTGGHKVHVLTVWICQRLLLTNRVSLVYVRTSWCLISSPFHFQSARVTSSPSPTVQTQPMFIEPNKGLFPPVMLNMCFKAVLLECWFCRVQGWYIRAQSWVVALPMSLARNALHHLVWCAHRWYHRETIVWRWEGWTRFGTDTKLHSR